VTRGLGRGIFARGYKFKKRGLTFIADRNTLPASREHDLGSDTSWTHRIPSAKDKPDIRS